MNTPNYDKIIVFDTETVSLKPNYIISIAYLYYYKGKRLDSGYLICNPEYPIDPNAGKVNGFTDENVQDYPTFPEIYKEFSDYLEDSVWVCHNLAFDQRAIESSCTKNGLNVPHHWTCCTYENAKNLIPKTQIKNYKLDVLCDYFNIEFSNHHTASFDTLGCQKIFNQLIKLSGGQLIVHEKPALIYNSDLKILESEI